MLTATKRKVAARCGDGHIRLIEDDVPELVPGSVSVEVHASLVSPGTELGGWHALRKKRDAGGEARPEPFGYANAGVVTGVGDGVNDLAAGDRIACMGGRYALHTDFTVVPHNLCVKLPDNVTFAQASYGHLAATSLMSLRRGAPALGEYVAVAGLGIVGHLAARFYQLAGCYVVGWDTVPFRTDLAEKCGLDAVVAVGREDEVEKTTAFTGGKGLDGGVLAFGGDGTKALESLTKCMKRSPDGHPMGRIVVVGGTKFAYPSTCTNIDICRSSRTGPGYHDEAWEYGPDYPPVFMRWTTKTNLELCMRLISEGALDVDALTTHEIPLDDVEEEISRILDDPDRVLGVVFKAR